MSLRPVFLRFPPTCRVLLLAVVVLLAVAFTGPVHAEGKTRLFILSGQSNMVRMDPEVSFTPAVKEAFAGDEVIVVKHAIGGKPIRQWYRDYEIPGLASSTKGNGGIYKTLMEMVEAETEGKTKPDSIVFVWMQGEADSKNERVAAVYEGSLNGLLKQLRGDMGRDDIGAVVGRINLFGLETKPRAGWGTVREAQVAVAEGDPLVEWVDLDDLGKGLHYNEESYKVMGQRFAERAIALSKKSDAN